LYLYVVEPPASLQFTVRQVQLGPARCPSLERCATDRSERPPSYERGHRGFAQSADTVGSAAQRQPFQCTALRSSSVRAARRRSPAPPRGRPALGWPSRAFPSTGSQS
jgi:hypothetical protein